MHLATLPPLANCDRALVGALVQDGVVLTNLASLALPETERLQEVLGGFRDQLMMATSNGHSTLRPSHDQLVADAFLWRWGLNVRLLDIVENYLGVARRYYGADVRREVADGRCTDVRQWHRDTEDERLFKVLIWLNNVDVDGGPFQYISRARTARATDSLRYVTGYISD